MPTLAERRQQAIDAGFKPAQLAGAAGVSSSAVAQWRNLTTSLSPKAAFGLAQLTGWLKT